MARSVTPRNKLSWEVHVRERLALALALTFALVASIGASGTASAQSGAVGGTVGKINKSVSGGDNDTPARRSVPVAKPAVDPCQRIAGTWSWFVGGDTVISVDGTGHNAFFSFTWTCSAGNYVLKWSHGYVDRLQLSADGKMLDGSNGSARVWGTRK
jgi:hypothetical protein